MAQKVEFSEIFNIDSTTTQRSSHLEMNKKSNPILGVTFTNYGNTTNASDTIKFTFQHSLDPNARAATNSDNYWATLFEKTYTDPDLNSLGLTASIPVHIPFDMYDVADITNRAKGEKGVGNSIRVKITTVDTSGSASFVGVVYIGHDTAVTS